MNNNNNNNNHLQIINDFYINEESDKIVEYLSLFEYIILRVDNKKLFMRLNNINYDKESQIVTYQISYYNVSGRIYERKNYITSFTLWFHKYKDNATFKIKFKTKLNML